MLHLPSIALATCLFALSANAIFATPVSAQSLPPTFRLAPELAFSLRQLPDQPTPPSFDQEELRKLRKGRALVATGVGLLAGAAASIALGFEGRDCSPGRLKSALAIGGAALGAGLALNVGGIIRLSRMDEVRQQRRASGTLGLLALGSAATAFFASMLVALPEQAACYDER